MVQLAGVETACWLMGELLLGLITAWVVLQIGGAVVKMGWQLVDKDNIGLVTAWLDVVLEVVELDAALEVLLVWWLELAAAELASALLLAWKSAARFLSFKTLLWLLCLEGLGG